MTCQSCGQTIRASSIGDLCPRCLILGALEPPTQTSPDFQPPPPEEFQPFFEDYQIQSLIGRGGMGAVYLAQQLSLDRKVAIKILPLEHFDSNEATARFRQEARTLARLSHQNIVSIFDFGEKEDFFFLVMEYVEGTDLATLLESDLLPISTALDLVKQICTALQFAHDQSIVHRDIKPANILLSTSGQIKIADFGLAKLLGNPDSILHQGLTSVGEKLGTPHYMSPEQRRGASDADHRADIYSTGVVFYEMLTGELPSGNFPLPSKSRQVDQRIDQIVLRAMEQKPNRRFQNASELGSSVDSLAHPSKKKHLLLLLLPLLLLPLFFLKNDRPPKTDESFKAAILKIDQSKAGERAGESVFIRSDVAFVGAINGVEGNGHPGSVCIFAPDSKNNWKEVHRLTAHRGVNRWDLFGYLTANNEWLAVGSPFSERLGGIVKNSGRVHLFHAPLGTDPKSWEFRDTLSVGLPTGSERFGYHLTMSTDQLAIMADSLDQSKGATLYLYQLQDQNWKLKTTLSGFEMSPPALLKGLLAIPKRRLKSDHYGAIAIYENQNGEWQQTALLQPDTHLRDEQFGFHLHFDGPDKLLIGAIHTPNQNGSRGAVYRAERHETGWQLTDTITPSDPGADSFGNSITISGDHLAIAAYQTAKTGVVYQYTRQEDDWVFQKKITPEKQARSFGRRIHSNQEHLIIGCPGDNSGKKRSGGVSILPLR